MDPQAHTTLQSGTVITAHEALMP